MSAEEPCTLIRDVRTLFRDGAMSGLSDRQLLKRFNRGGGAADAAFETLVERHGAMVWGVCRRILHDPHDAADAFQATFLVLLRRGPSVLVEDSVARWLYGVGRKVATRARRARLQRPGSGDSGDADASRHAFASDPDPALRELMKALDEEIDALPEPYQAAVVLCDLGGLTHEEAARRLECAVGTIGSRVARGRHRLRVRLQRRGLAPTTGALAAAIAAGRAHATPPTALVRSTVRVVVERLGPATLAGSVPATVAALVEGVGGSMFPVYGKWLAAAVVSLGLAAGGTFLQTLQASGDDRPQPKGNGPSTPGEGRAEVPARNTDDLRSVHDELDLLKAELARKQAEAKKAEAQMELGLAIVATSRRLNERRPGMVSDVEMRKNEAEVKVGQAMRAFAQAEIDEVKLRIKQVESFAHRPDQFEAFLARRNALRASLTQNVSVVELETQVRKKKAEVARASAQIETARAVVDVNRLHNTRRKGMVSPEELRRLESAVKLAESEAEINRADLAALELRLHRARATDPLAETKKNEGGSDFADLERRMADLERKVDRVLEQLKAGSGKGSP